MPLPPPAPAPPIQRNLDSPADQALSKIVDLLLEDGYGFTIPAWEGDAFLKISNARGALTDLTISDQGTVIWEYRSARGGRVDPVRLITVTLTLLDPEAKIARPELPSRDGRVFILNAASHALFRCGLTTSRHHSDPDAFTVLTVTNPSEPVRGAVDITDDGELTWQVRAPHHRDGGLVLPDIAGSISLALLRAQHHPSHA